MSLQFIFTSGIIIVILFLVGLLYTFKEFREMENHPENYRRRDNEAFVDREEDKP
ncbi:MAG TPA: hypothetical protein VJ915_02220 [Balneolaceae bacterium]|nr:hypothetical protein [Balneolaceae bacterium]